MGQPMHAETSNRSGKALQVLKDSGSAAHDSSTTHVAGGSEFIDDRPMLPGELFVAPVFAPHAVAELISADFSGTLAVPGVVAVISADDVRENLWGAIFRDQPVLARDRSAYAGEVFFLVAAESQRAMRAGVAAARLKWRKLTRIMTIRDAIAAGSFFGTERRIARGDAVSGLSRAPRRLRGTLVIEGAEHFYLESQAAVAYPRERGQLEVHASTQHPSEAQHVVAAACGLSYGQVTVIVKRLGGGFGGKESQASPVAAWAALVAQKTGRPARVILTKDDDMIITGKRHPFEIDYEVGFAKDGEILALDAQLWSDGGAYADLSTAIMERALLHSDNAYFIPDMRVAGRVCRTNHHPHTAFRGFGGPKGMLLIEGIIEDIAAELRLDALEIRRRNVYRPGHDTTHYGQKVENNLLPDLLGTLASKCDYAARREDIIRTAATRQPGDLHRGMSLTTVKFGISFTTRFLNQGNALVCLHRDGSIQVSTGAVEMGQGVNTRIALLVAEQFGIAPSRVEVLATATDRNANTSPTAASSGTDINGSAAVAACAKLRARLGGLFLALEKIDRKLWPSATAGLGTQAEIVVSDAEPAEPVEFRDGFVFARSRWRFPCCMLPAVKICFHLPSFC